MKRLFGFLIITLFMLVLPSSAWAQEEDQCDQAPDTRIYSSNYDTSDCRFVSRQEHPHRENAYFIMEPGWRVVLEGESDGEFIRVETTVTNETVRIAGVRTRVIEEVEFIDGELYEISRNFYAICTLTNDIYYFGEDVDFYEDGEIISHEGAWRVGVDGATPGVLMPGSPMVGARFQQENSTVGEALDRAEILGFTSMEVNGMQFDNVLMLLEGSPLGTPCDAETKYYAPGIGNIIDEELEIVEAGFVFQATPRISFKDNP